MKRNIAPPSSTVERKRGRGALAKAGLNKNQAVEADSCRSRHVITLISKNSGIDYFFSFFLNLRFRKLLALLRGFLIRETELV